jgi:hypothetical protein
MEKLNADAEGEIKEQSEAAPSLPAMQTASTPLTPVPLVFVPPPPNQLGFLSQANVGTCQPLHPHLAPPHSCVHFTFPPSPAPLWVVYMWEFIALVATCIRMHRRCFSMIFQSVPWSRPAYPSFAQIWVSRHALFYPYRWITRML